ncbi:MAG: GldG family protein [Planctomycetes bacterium]|nr:GldG family protein [Planctomycetota bacterium]
MTTAPERRRRSFALCVLLVAANLVLLNWIALGRFARVDLTRDRLFTLHEATCDLLAGLDDLVTLRVFMSEKKFREQAAYAAIPREIRDLLDEYAARARGKLLVEYLDPSDDSELRLEARGAGLHERSLQGFGEESLVVFTCYLGIVLSYGGKPDQVVEISYPIETLEYSLDLAIARLTQKETITIGFNSIRPRSGAGMRGLGAEAFDEHDIDGDYQTVKQALARQFEVERMPMDREIPAHVDLLVVHNVAHLDDRAQFYLDQYLMHGGKLVILAEGIERNRQVGVLAARPVLPDALFARYGFTIKRNLVLDQQCAPSDQGLPLYFIPELIERYFDPESPLMSGLKAFHVFEASAIELNPPAGVSGLVLARSTPGAWAQEGFFDTDTRTLRPPARLGEYRQFDMVGLLSGEFKSFYSDRALPEGVATSDRGPTRADFERQGLSLEEEEGEEEDAKEEQGEEPAEAPPQDPGEPETELPGAASVPFIREKSPQTAIVVIGNSRFLCNEIVRSAPGNLPFFWTLVDRLTVGSRLSEVQNRSAAPPSIKADLSPAEKRLVKYCGMLGMPLVVLVLGVLLFVLRRTRNVSVQVEP